MPLSSVLADFKTEVTQCDGLIATAHRTDANGTPLFAQAVAKQITTAAFLNFFIAWETYLESCLTELMMGQPTISGNVPVKYVSPVSLDSARAIVTGTQRYFDYGNHDYFLKLVKLYFENGYPFEPHFSGIFVDLADLRTMRNASAHITSSTQTALESLAQRILTTPRMGIDLYALLTTNDPRQKPSNTVYGYYKSKLLVAAELIANG